MRLARRPDTAEVCATKLDLWKEELKQFRSHYGV